MRQNTSRCGKKKKTLFTPLGISGYGVSMHIGTRLVEIKEAWTGKRKVTKEWQRIRKVSVTLKKTKTW